MPIQEREITPLKVSIHDGKVCEKILKIEVAGEEIQKEYDHYYNSIAMKAKIPGFRPGKAPRNVLAMHYGNDAREAVLKNLISDSYRDAVKEKSLEPLGYPDIKDVQFEDNKLSYQAKVEIRPKIKLSRVAGLSAKKEKTEIKNDEVDQALNRMRESLAQFKAVEDRAAALGDFVITDYVCIVDGKELIFMIMDDQEVHPTYDVGIWVNTPFFASALEGMFNTAWKGMKEPAFK